MPRRSSRLAQQKRVNYNEDAMFYRRTQTKKSDWEEVEDLDPVPIRRKPLYRKRLEKKKKIIDLAPKPKKIKKREILDRDDEKLAVIERDEQQVDYAFESASERKRRIDTMDRRVLKADPQTNQISKKRRHLLFLNPGDGAPEGHHEFSQQPAPPTVGRAIRAQPPVRSCQGPTPLG